MHLHKLGKNIRTHGMGGGIYEYVMYNNTHYHQNIHNHYHHTHTQNYPLHTPHNKSYHNQYQDHNTNRRTEPLLCQVQIIVRVSINYTSS